MQTSVQKWGNSMGLRIPKSIATELGLAPGALVELSVRAGRMILVPSPPEGSARARSLAELLEGVTEANRHSEIATGPSLAGEAW